MKRTVHDLGSSRPHNGERTRELRADAAVFAAIFVAAIEVGAATLAVVSVVTMLVDIRSTSCDDQNQGFGAFRAFGCSELPCGFSIQTYTAWYSRMACEALSLAKTRFNHDTDWK